MSLYRWMLNRRCKANSSTVRRSIIVVVLTALAVAADPLDGYPDLIQKVRQINEATEIAPDALASIAKAVYGVQPHAPLNALPDHKECISSDLLMPAYARAQDNYNATVHQISLKLEINSYYGAITVPQGAFQIRESSR